MTEEARRGTSASTGAPAAIIAGTGGGPGCRPETRGRTTKIETNLARALGAAAVTGAAALLGYALWWRKNPSACPYALRLFVDLPHPLITRARLREILAPRPGERVLEVGPGTGYYALQAARWLEPGGTLEVLDLQQEMLDQVRRRARMSGIANVVATRGDARALPYPDGAFDAATLRWSSGRCPTSGRPCGSSPEC